MFAKERQKDLFVGHAVTHQHPWYTLRNERRAQRIPAGWATRQLRPLGAATRGRGRCPIHVIGYERGSYGGARRSHQCLEAHGMSRQALSALSCAQVRSLVNTGSPPRRASTWFPSTPSPRRKDGPQGGLRGSLASIPFLRGVIHGPSIQSGRSMEVDG